MKACADSNAQLVVVSKTRPTQAIMQFYDSGQRFFGENRVQELCEKAAQLPTDVEWHMIGHLQTNKVKYISSFVHTIHAVDSEKLLWQIDKEAEKHQRMVRCLLQLHIAQEESKHGFKDEDEVVRLLLSDKFSAMKNVSIAGVMGMASLTDNSAQIRSEFQRLKRFSTMLKSRFVNSQHPLNEISMGMSSDYEMALEEGATIIRVGSLLFE